jgi:hypothetical protein
VGTACCCTYHSSHPAQPGWRQRTCCLPSSSETEAREEGDGSEPLGSVLEVITEGSKILVCPSRESKGSAGRQRQGGQAAKTRKPISPQHQVYYMECVEQKILMAAVKLRMRAAQSFGYGETAPIIRFQVPHGHWRLDNLSCTVARHTRVLQTLV